MKLKKFAVQIKPDQQPVRIDASTIDKAMDIAESVYGDFYDAYQLHDTVISPAMFSE
jgi:hypothetical protein